MASLHRGAQALETLAADEEPVLWPEPFDASVTVGDVNYGVSADDSYHPRPYAYARPTDCADGSVLESAFRSAAILEPGDDVAAITDFFNQGQEHLT